MSETQSMLSTADINPVIEESWKKVLVDEFSADYFKALKAFLLSEKKSGMVVYPGGKDIFAAFNHTPFEKVKVVLLGQDPYHGAGQAHGLSFSVPEGVKPPPSLVNMFKELKMEYGYDIPRNGNLEKWARQGVLLLNAMLSVRAGVAGSHQNKGWEPFTDAVIRELSEKRRGLVFLLWGKYAQAKERLIDSSKHFVLKAPHPSPFSADSGFFGCGHFKKANEILKQEGKEEIDWQIN
jgi:uracil-DNA glycosylase